jgi:predicted nuclease of predicted toxin-antitoxin system
VKFLVDAQLPVRLCRWLRDRGHDAVHVTERANGNRSTDAEVAAAADSEDRIVVSKDADFRHDHLLHDRPRRLLAVATGNISNAALLDLFGANLVEIVAALEEGRFVEMTATELVVRS